MERWDLIIKWLVAAGGSAASYLFGGWNTLLEILILFVVIDFITGIIASAVCGELNSEIGLIGITKKVFIFIIIVVAYKIDSILGSSHFLQDSVTLFYLSNKLLTIIENSGRIGMPIPTVVKQAVEILRNKGEDEDKR